MLPAKAFVGFFVSDVISEVVLVILAHVAWPRAQPLKCFAEVFIGN